MFQRNEWVGFTLILIFYILLEPILNITTEYHFGLDFWDHVSTISNKRREWDVLQVISQLACSG